MTPTPDPSFLTTRRGKLTLALLCAVAFLDFVDAPIVNVALPSIRRALHFSEQNLVWVPSGYLLTYGGFMLLGGRAADLLGRREPRMLADSVGLALLVVLETLAPAERLAFVLHDMFAVPFEEIAPIVGHSATAARQLASRGRRRVQAVATVPDADLTRQREVVDAFLAAARGGGFEAGSLRADGRLR